MGAGVEWAHLDAVEVVDGQDRALEVLVLEEAKPLRLARFLVPHKVDVLNLAIPGTRMSRLGAFMAARGTGGALREDAEHIALGQLVRQATEEYPRALTVLPMP